ncbi:RNA recognition motif. (a.k.a. RRM, RBD, or RNP domain) [Nesidiocoris tenuis]|uniref:RNA recognition motif. (A.k.a. RRM, RBD, or RNP domain) n=1 Tax=Nesidiocoris tenuis TaxID=355587 RepID=A0ABN7AWQ1_9HEMI|nr:RNA recognition motif. (a.k.a. RRM, RBD, or RNP domain) [Nesidiocoris tenuis]
MAGKQSSRLYVGGLGGTPVPQQDIEDLFNKFGHILEVRLNKNFAFVQYRDEDSAAAALQTLNGKNHFGKKLDVQFARPSRVGNEKPGNDNPSRDRSPIGNRGGGGGGPGGGGPGGRGGPPGGRPGGQFGDDRGPFSGPNRGGGRPMNDRDGGPSPFGGRDPGRDSGRDFGGRGDFDRGGPGGRPDFDRGGPGLGRGDFDRGGPMGGRGDMDRGGRGDPDRAPWGGGGDRPDPWSNGGQGRGPPPRDGDFRGGPGDFRDRDLGGRGPLDGHGGRGPDGPGGRPDWGRNDFGGDRFGGRPGGFRDDFRGDRGDFPRGDIDGGRGGPPAPSWVQHERERPPNSDPIPLSTSNADRTNDIEIIVANKSITDYGEYIESRLKSLGFTVDIMFPNESAPIARVLGNIASRGTLYAIIVNPAHKLNRSLTLQVLHGTPQEHRNMLIEDAIIFLNRNFENYSRRQTEKRGPNAPPEQVRHLLELVITAARQLTPTQFDILIQYFVNEKIKAEPLEPKEILPVTPQAELQTRILSILNKNAAGGGGGPQPLMGLTNVAPPGKDSQSPLLKDPSVQRALDSLMQGGSKFLSAINNQNRF